MSGSFGGRSEARQSNLLPRQSLPVQRDAAVVPATGEGGVEAAWWRWYGLDHPVFLIDPWGWYGAPAHWWYGPVYPTYVYGPRW